MLQASADGAGQAYDSWGRGLIEFDANNDDDDKSGISKVGGQAQTDVTDWRRASGDILRFGADAKFSISRPGDPRRIELDFSDPYAPKRNVTLF